MHVTGGALSSNGLDYSVRNRNLSVRRRSLSLCQTQIPLCEMERSLCETQISFCWTHISLSVRCRYRSVRYRYLSVKDAEIFLSDAGAFQSDTDVTTFMVWNTKFVLITDGKLILRGFEASLNTRISRLLGASKSKITQSKTCNNKHNLPYYTIPINQQMGLPQ